MGKLFGTCCDGEIEIRSLTTADFDEALELLHKLFFINESVSVGTEINLNLPESLQARDELTEFTRIVAKDGVSLIAVHGPSKIIVGAAFNKIQCLPKPGEKAFFVEHNNKCKSPNAKALMEYMITMDQQVDAFEIFSIDCLMEITFLVTHPDFGRKHIGRTLCKYSIDLARNLLNGADTELLSKEINDKRPKAVTALFTSKFSQKIGDTLGFEILNQVSYTENMFKGKTFAERIGPEHPFCTQAAIKL